MQPSPLLLLHDIPRDDVIRRFLDGRLRLIHRFMRQRAPHQSIVRRHAQTPQRTLRRLNVFLKLRRAHALGLADIREALSRAAFIRQIFARFRHHATAQVTDDMAILIPRQPRHHHHARVVGVRKRDSIHLRSGPGKHRRALGIAGLFLRFLRRHVVLAQARDDFLQLVRSGQTLRFRHEFRQIEFALRRRVVMAAEAVVLEGRRRRRGGQGPGEQGGCGNQCWKEKSHGLRVRNYRS